MHNNLKIERKSEKYKNKDFIKAETSKGEIRAIMILLVFSDSMKTKP